MKRLIVVITILMLVNFPGISMADFTGGKSKSNTSTVQEFEDQCDLKTSGKGLLGSLISAGVEGAKCDEIKFVLEGNVIGKVSNNVYEFKDATGTVYVEIRDWDGVDAGPEDLVRIKGEAEIEEVGLVLEVEKLELVK